MNRSFDACYTPAINEGPCSEDFEHAFNLTKNNTERVIKKKVAKRVLLIPKSHPQLDLCAIHESKPHFNNRRLDKILEVCYFPPPETTDDLERKQQQFASNKQTLLASILGMSILCGDSLGACKALQVLVRHLLKHNQATDCW